MIVIYMKKSFFILIFCTIMFNIYSHVFYVRAVDEQNGAAIPYCSFSLVKSKSKGISNAGGLIRLDSEIYRIVKGDTLLCRSFGYEGILFPLDYDSGVSDTLLVRLRVILPDLEVFSKKGRKLKRRVIGKKNNHGIMNCIIHDLDSSFTAMDITSGFEVRTKKGISELTKFGLYIKQHEKMMTNMIFRINIYDMSDVNEAPTDKFKIVHPPIYVEFDKSMVPKDKFTYEFPAPVILPSKAMVEIEFTEPLNGKIIWTKGNLIGGSVWCRLNSVFGDKDPLVRPFFIEVNTYQ